MITYPLLAISPPTWPNPWRSDTPSVHAKHPEQVVRPLTVADAMLTVPKIFRTDTTVSQARHAFTDDHVHALLIVQHGVLQSVIERPDLGVEARNDEPVLRLGSLAGRIIGPDNDLDSIRTWMVSHQCRRLAVVGFNLDLLGLLCLKRSRRGFCSDADVCSRDEIEP